MTGIALLNVIPSATRGEDVITLKGEDKEQPTTQIKADVVDWTQNRLVYHSNGRTHEIPARRVSKVDYVKHAEHHQAEQLLEQQKFQQAIGAFDVAIQKEDREWVKREIVAGKIRAANGLGNIDSSINWYVQLMDAAPESRFDYLIPLTWRSRSPAGTVVGEFGTWIQGDDETKALIASSWLFSGNSSLAEEKLKSLRRSSNPTIAHLATAQLWRNQTLTVDETLLKRWQQHLDRMPKRLRAGPTFLVGLALQRLGKTDQATIAWMQVPILYPEQYQLGGDSLFAAFRQLEADGNQTEAELVRNELTTRYRVSDAASQVNQNVESFENDK